MSRKKIKQENFSYFYLIKSSILHPKIYTQTISEFSKLKDALFFFITIFSLGFFIRICFNGILHKSFSFFFLGIDTLLLSIPFLLFFLILLILIFYCLSKLLGGRATLLKTLIISAYCSTPLLIVIWIPLVSLIALAQTLFILILGFKRTNQFSFAKSMVAILIPFFIFILILILLGLINSILQTILFF